MPEFNFSNSRRDQTAKDPSAGLTSPGQLAVHYSPRTRAVRIEPTESWDMSSFSGRVAVLGLDPGAEAPRIRAAVGVLLVAAVLGSVLVVGRRVPRTRAATRVVVGDLRAVRVD